ncbi:MAG: gephyrin-like molybdotransferase Glp [Planctomycetota bacterium]
MTLTVREAQSEILSNVLPLGRVECVALSDSLGRVLARDCPSDVNVPSCDNSAMDGYAVRASDLAGAQPSSPARLRLVETIRAGDRATRALEVGETYRIFTGALLPPGADAVVMQEDVLVEGAAILFRSPVRLQANVRLAGEDLRFDDTAVPAGSLLRPQEIGVLASAGHDSVPVVARPRVAVLSTGSELVGVRDLPEPGQVRNSNAFTLEALVRETGCQPILFPPVPDDVPATREALSRACGTADADLVLTSGGVSVGDYDLVLNCLQALGWRKLFWKVRMKPGHPVAAGLLHGKLVLGLPGNPVSVAVAFLQFARPALRKMLGLQRLLPATISASLLEPYNGKGDREHFVPCTLEARPDGSWAAGLSLPHGSGILRSLSLAQGLLVVPLGTKHIPAGSTVSVQPFTESLYC